MARITRISSSLVAFVFLFAGHAGAQFTRNTTSVPTSGIGYTENVDFGDVDNDGDWDAIFADGGDFGNQQNRIWINQGGLQAGTLGTFVDQTAARLPVLLDDSRDVEFADVDNDGDLDVHVSNTSSVVNQSNRWVINMGGIQGGTAGFFQDQTSTRWVNLGVNNGSTFSSIPQSQLVAGGGFLDWSCDSDFGDIDNDGDLDLVHSTYGAQFQGNSPTRFFLNDGAGRFEEFNPSHFQLTNATISNGMPGLWASGMQTANTVNATGAFCDIAAAALDIEFGDVDGDLDLDLLHGDRANAPRMFQNRLAENGGTLVAWRDVTGASFAPGYATGQGHYEQEMGDLDSDGDLDIYGLNWLVSSGGGLVDSTLENDGLGFFSNSTVIPNSAIDDNEVDYLDYDMDGDLDVFITAYGAPNRLYRNDWTGGAFSFTHVSAGNLPTETDIGLDADSCDVDQDGDSDLFAANDVNQAEWYYQNTSTANDVFAPAVVSLELVPARASSPVPTVIRVMVNDNAAYYTTWYNTTVLEYSVDGGAFTPLAMRSSAGQIFRAELPGCLFGTIAYRVRSTDKYGNQGVSVTRSYVATGPLSYCTAKTNSQGCVPSIAFLGVPSATAASGFVLQAMLERNNEVGLVLYSENGRDALPFGAGGRLCVKAPMRRSKAVNSGGSPPPAVDCSGVYSIDFNAFARGLLGGAPSPADWLSIPGYVVTAQFWGRDTGFAAPNNFSLSNALEYTICP